MTTTQRRVRGVFRRMTMSAELRRGVFAGVAIYGTGVLVRTINELVFARLMGTQDFGAYSYIFAWLSILAVTGGIGIPYAFVRFIPEYEVFKNHGAIQRLVRYGRVTALGYGLLIGLLGVVIILPFRPSGVDAVAVLVGMASVPSLSVLTVQSEIARGFRRIVLAYFPILVLRPLLAVLFALAILIRSTHLSADDGLWSGLIAILVCLVVQRSRVHRLLTTRARLTSAEPAQVEPILAGTDTPEIGADQGTSELSTWHAVALPLLVINVLAAVAMRADVIVVGLFRGSSAAGIYAVAARVALLSTFALDALNTIVAPTIAKLFYAEDHEAVQRLVRGAARVTFTASLAVTLVLEIAGTHSLTIFGPGFAGGMTALQILLVGQLVNASTGPVLGLMVTTGHQQFAAFAQFISTVLFIVSAIVFTHLWGIVGTAVAVSIARATINIWMVFAGQARLKIRSFIV